MFQKFGFEEANPVCKFTGLQVPNTQILKAGAKLRFLMAGKKGEL